MEIEHLDEEADCNISSKASLNTTDTSMLNFENADSNDKKLDLISKSKDTIYGNDINIKNPFKLGNSYAFLYVKNQPLIIIGPHCNI